MSTGRQYAHTRHGPDHEDDQIYLSLIAQHDGTVNAFVHLLMLLLIYPCEKYMPRTFSRCS